MWWTIVAFVVGVVFMAGCLIEVSDGNSGSAWVSGVISVFCFFISTFVVGPVELGYGRIFYAMGGYADRLVAGTLYQTRGSIKEPDGYIVVVKDIEANSSYALHVSVPPPAEYFTLLNGQPAAINPPILAAPVATN